MTRTDRRAYHHAASLALHLGVDPAAPGAAVTVALCGHWDHDPPCRWPHNSRLLDAAGTSSFRTVFTCEPGDEAQVRALIDGALRSGSGWQVLGSGAAPVTDEDAALAQRLLDGPHR